MIINGVEYPVGTPTYTLDENFRCFRLAGLTTIAVQGDENSSAIILITPRYYKNLDLSTKEAWIRWSTEWLDDEGKPSQGKVNLIDFEIIEDKINYVWVLDIAQTYKNGRVNFGLGWESENWTFNAKGSCFEVQRFVESGEHYISPTIADLLQQEIDELNATVTELGNSKQDKTDPDLQTTDKTVVGAINGLNSDKADTSYVNEKDNNLQEQIDVIASSSDVVDVVGTYADLEAYDTSKLKNNDIVKVLQDETRGDAITYYRWVINQQTHEGSWNYIGSLGPYYTETQTNVLLAGKQDIIQKTGSGLDDEVDVVVGGIYQCLSNHDATQVHISGDTYFVKGHFYEYYGDHYYVRIDTQPMPVLPNNYVKLVTGEWLNETPPMAYPGIYQCTTTEYGFEEGYFYRSTTSDTWERLDVQPAPTTDQTYNSSSTNAQSGTAVAEAVEALTGTSAPTTSTVGYIGQFYIDTTNKITYQCIAVTAQGTTPETYEYTWTPYVRTISAAGIALTPDASGNVNIPYITSGGSGYGVVRLADKQVYGLDVLSPTGGYVVLYQQSNNEIISTPRAGYSNNRGAAVRAGSVDLYVKLCMTDGQGATWTDSEKNLCYDRTTIRKTTLDNVLVPNAMYDLGSTEQASLTLTLPTPNVPIDSKSVSQLKSSSLIKNIGDVYILTDNGILNSNSLPVVTGNWVIWNGTIWEKTIDNSCNDIYVAFKSGSTATTLTISGTYVGDTSYTPSANSICELSFKYICGTWVLTTKETATTV